MKRAVSRLDVSVRKDRESCRRLACVFSMVFLFCEDAGGGKLLDNFRSEVCQEDSRVGETSFMAGRRAKIPLSMKFSSRDFRKKRESIALIFQAECFDNMDIRISKQVSFLKRCSSIDL